MLSVNTKDNTNDIKFFKDRFSFRNWNKEHPLIRNQNEKLLVKNKRETIS